MLCKKYLSKTENWLPFFGLVHDADELGIYKYSPKKHIFSHSESLLCTPVKVHQHLLVIDTAIGMTNAVAIKRPRIMVPLGSRLTPSPHPAAERHHPDTQAPSLIPLSSGGSLPSPPLSRGPDRCLGEEGPRAERDLPAFNLSKCHPTKLVVQHCHLVVLSLP